MPTSFSLLIPSSTISQGILGTALCSASSSDVSRLLRTTVLPRALARVLNWCPEKIPLKQ